MLAPLIRRQFALTAVIFVAALAGAHLLSRLLTRMDHVHFLQNQADLVLFALSLSGEERVEAVKKMRAINDRNHSPLQIDLVRGENSLLTGERLQPSPAMVPRPPELEFPLADDPSTRLLVRLGPPPESGGPLLMTLLLFAAILLASFASAALLFWRFRDKAATAKSVLSRIQQGDLKARFPVSRWEDASRIMTLFNSMADEIERLVSRVQANDRSRMQMLADIAHDLRTPLASLRTAMDGLKDNEGAGSRQIKAEFAQIAERETEYLDRLVEDLLFLAVMIEPKYRTSADRVAIEPLIRAQLSAVAAKFPHVQWSIHGGTNGNAAIVCGDPHLLVRLIRNALENAFSFAKGRVTIDLHNLADGRCRVQITDDGPGFTNEALSTFGTKRATRYLAANHLGSRLSVGLGSVIMRAIMAAHSGSLEPENVTLPSGATGGARLTLFFNGSSAA